MKLKDLKVDKPYQSFLLIKDAALRTSKNGNYFLKLTLSDEDYNETTGFLWNISENEAKKYPQGSLVKVLGKGKTFNDSLQIDIQRIRPATITDEVELSDFIEVAPEDSEEMRDEILRTIDSFENEDLKRLTKAAVESRGDELLSFPAAKSVHHAMKGGLLYHTLSMLRLAKDLLKFYPFLNSDLLLSGVILHDLGKIDEMDADERGIVEDYTTEGKLLGHITQGIVELSKLGEELDIDPEVMMLVKHMILSHHYEPEYGSPVKPMFPEAELLHHIDIIDARMNTMGKLSNKLEPGSFSERQAMLDGIKLYKPKI